MPHGNRVVLFTLPRALVVRGLAVRFSVCLSGCFKCIIRGNLPRACARARAAMALSWQDSWQDSWSSTLTETRPQ